MTGAITAAGLAVAAAAALASVVFAATAPALLVAAGTAYVAAEVAHRGAEDPPNPDPHYQDPVEVAPLRLAQWPSELTNEALVALRSLLETASHLLALEEARTLSRARLMGAELANNAEALETQRDGYLRLERLKRRKSLDRFCPMLSEQLKKTPFSIPTLWSLGRRDRSRRVLGLDAENHG
jgi:hypothetical protein